jgi:hypothetical protein
LLFVWEYDLVAASEFDALKDIVREIRLRYGLEEKPSEPAHRLSFFAIGGK